MGDLKFVAMAIGDLNFVTMTMEDLKFVAMTIGDHLKQIEMKEKTFVLPYLPSTPILTKSEMKNQKLISTKKFGFIYKKGTNTKLT